MNKLYEGTNVRHLLGKFDTLVQSLRNDRVFREILVQGRNTILRRERQDGTSTYCTSVRVLIRYKKMEQNQKVYDKEQEPCESKR